MPVMSGVWGKRIMGSSLGYIIRASLLPQTLKNPGVDGSADDDSCVVT